MRSFYFYLKPPTSFAVQTYNFFMQYTIVYNLNASVGYVHIFHLCKIGEAICMCSSMENKPLFSINEEHYTSWYGGWFNGRSRVATQHSLVDICCSPAKHYLISTTVDIAWVRDRILCTMANVWGIATCKTDVECFCEARKRRTTDILMQWMSFC